MLVGVTVGVEDVVGVGREVVGVADGDGDLLGDLVGRRWRTVVVAAGVRCRGFGTFA